MTIFVILSLIIFIPLLVWDDTRRSKPQLLKCKVKVLERK